MKPLIYKVFSVFEKSFYFGVYEAYLKNTMIHTSHFKIGAKKTLKRAFIFRDPLNSPLLTFFSLIISLFLLYSLLLLHICLYVAYRWFTENYIKILNFQLVFLITLTYKTI